MVEAWRTHDPCTQTDAYLHQTNWDKHASWRTEIQGHQDDARLTAEDPDFAIENDSGTVFKYRKGLGSGKTANLRLLVIEKADSQGSHFVKTVYFTPDIADGHLLCGPRLI